jgi:hypothetical protein
MHVIRTSELSFYLSRSAIYFCVDTLHVSVLWEIIMRDMISWYQELGSQKKIFAIVLYV